MAEAVAEFQRKRKAIQETQAKRRALENITNTNHATANISAMLPFSENSAETSFIQIVEDKEQTTSSKDTN